MEDHEKHKKDQKIDKIKFTDVDDKIIELAIHMEKLILILNKDDFYNYVLNITYNKETGYFSDNKGHETYVKEDQK